MFFGNADGNGRTACEFNGRGISNIVGVQDDHFISRLHQGTHGEVHPFRTADRDYDFLFRIVNLAVAFFMKPGDFPAQLDQSAIGRVMGIAVNHGIDGTFAYVPGSRKIRFAHSQ